jgi:hypothetical protein
VIIPGRGGESFRALFFMTFRANEQGRSGVAMRADFRVARLTKVLFVTFFLAFGPAGCEKTPSGIVDDDVSILKALLQHTCQQLPADRFEAISDVAAGVAHDLRIPSDWNVPGSVSAQLMQSSQSLVKWPHVIECPSIKVIDGERAEFLIAQDKRVPHSWQGLRAAYPGLHGLSAVSRPAYTRERDRAFAVMQGRLESFSDYGALYEFVRAGNEWRVSRSKSLWVHSL